jgi:hypothetical protein
MKDLKTSIAFTGVIALLLSATAYAQPGPGVAAGARAFSTASAPAPGPGAGGMMRGRSGSGYTHGWGMMNRAERDEHRRLMAQARTLDECRQVRDEHRKLMEQRARERGMRNLQAPRRDACGAFR